MEKSTKPFNIEKVVSEIEKPWEPIDLAVFDDRVSRIALFKGEYKLHSHDYDEFFLVYRGKIIIQTQYGEIALAEGQGTVIPKGMIHKPVADNPAYVLMVDRLDVEMYAIF